MGRLTRLLIAFAGFIPLASLAALFFFTACIAAFDPLAGASGNLARENPPSLWDRFWLASLFCGLSFMSFFFAALVAWYGFRDDGPNDSSDQTSSESVVCSPGHQRDANVR